MSFCHILPIRLLHEQTQGLGYSKNLAIKEARGRVLFWTDDDVIPDTEWLSELWSAIHKFEADWVFGRIEPLWPNFQPKWYSDRMRGCVGALNYGEVPFVVTQRNQPFFGANFGGTLDAHRLLGGFRPDFGFKGEVGGIGEDIDMFERAFGSGMRIVYTPHALIQHIISPEGRTRRFHRRRQWLANGVAYYYLGELYPGVKMLLGLPRFFYRKAASDVWGYLRGLVTFDNALRFFHEMQLLRFIRFLVEAAKNRFRAALPPTGGRANIGK